MDYKLITAINDWYNFCDVLEITAAYGDNDYKFNSATGIPDHVMKQTHEFLNKHKDKPLQTTRHLEDQARSGDSKHSLHPHDIPALKGKMPHPDNGFHPVEVSHNGKDVTKVVLRGPHSDTHDASIPVVERNGKPTATTTWVNHKDDAHRTLNKNKVHSPSEFKPGVPPSRKLQ